MTEHIPQNIYDPAFVRDIFDRCGPRYRLWSMLGSFGFVWIWRRSCVGNIPKDATCETVYDLMAGTGEIWPHFLRRFPHTARITAIDISTEMHKQAVERLHKAREEKIEHIEADILTTDLASESADIVISSFGLKTLDQAQQTHLAKQIASTLKAGGHFSLIEASDPKGWIFRPIFRFYMDKMLPLIERFLLKGAQDFAMIGIYTKGFGNCGYFADALRAEGLEVNYHKHFFGCATSVSGKKPK